MIAVKHLLCGSKACGLAVLLSLAACGGSGDDGRGASSSGGGPGGSGGGGGGGGSESRYIVLDEGSGDCQTPILEGWDGTGRVQDNLTGLVWTRFVRMGGPYVDHSVSLDQAQSIAYCDSVGARMPTKLEAIAIAATNHDRDAWPCGWETWTSTPPGDGSPGLAWTVHNSGQTATHGVTFIESGAGVLCVQGEIQPPTCDSARYAIDAQAATVVDMSTGLTWAQFNSGGSFVDAGTTCMGLGARLPTTEEALGIAGNNYDVCAWPNGWVTWTSTPAGANESAELVYDGGAVGGAHPDAEFGALCVR